jgi:lambda repressor-like predicted transcriptional regulator
MTRTDEAWDRFRIKAEVHRRGKTLTEIAIEAGLAESACRMALTGGSRKGALALSDFLDVPMHLLFPGLYLRVRPTRREPTPKPSPESRQNNGRVTDDRRLRA